MSVHQTIIIENPSGEPSIGIDETLELKPYQLGPNIIELNDFLMDKVVLLEQKSRTIQTICLTEMVVNLVIVFYGPLYLLSFYCISCMGYIGARDFNLPFVFIYTLYQFFATCGKMYLIVNTFGELENSLYALFCIVEIIQIIFFVYNLKFLKLMIHIKHNILE